MEILKIKTNMSSYTAVGIKNCVIEEDITIGNVSASGDGKSSKNIEAIGIQNSTITPGTKVVIGNVSATGGKNVRAVGIQGGVIDAKEVIIKGGVNATGLHFKFN